MCVHMCVCVCVFMPVCMYVHMHVCMYIHIYVHMYVCMHGMYIRTHVFRILHSVHYNSIIII